MQTEAASRTERMEAAIKVVPLSGAEEIECLHCLFEKVAADEGWRPDGQIRAYPGQSAYFAVMDDRVLAGGLQLVVGSMDGNLPCLTVWPELPVSGRTDVADVALIAFLPPYRGKNALFWRLLVEAWRHCDRAGIRELWMEVTPRTFKLYCRLGWPLEVMGPLRLHWGENCYPCRVGVRAMEELFAKKAAQSPFYRDLLEQARREEGGE